MAFRLRSSIPYVALVATLLLGSGLSLVLARPGPGLTERLKRAWVEAAARAYAQHQALLGAGRSGPDAVYRWSARWYEAQAAATKGKQPAAAHLKRMQALHTTIKKKHASGMATGADLAAAEYYLAEAKVWAAVGRGK